MKLTHDRYSVVADNEEKKNICKSRRVESSESPERPSSNFADAVQKVYNSTHFSLKNK